MSAQLKPTLADEIRAALEDAHRPLLPDEITERVTLTKHSRRVRQILDALADGGAILRSAEGYHRLGTRVKLGTHHATCALTDLDGNIVQPHEARTPLDRQRPYRPKRLRGHTAAVVALIRRDLTPRTYPEIAADLPDIKPKAVCQILHSLHHRGLVDAVDRAYSPISRRHLWRYRAAGALANPHQPRRDLSARIRRTLADSPMPLTARQIAERIDEPVARVQIACAGLIRRREIKRVDQIAARNRQLAWRYRSA